MQVIDALPPIGAAVRDHAIAASQSELLGDPPGNEEQVSRQILVRGSQMSDRLELLLGNEQDMRRRQRADVVKCEAQLVLVHDVGGDFLVDNPLEDRLFAHCRFAAWK